MLTGSATTSRETAPTEGAGEGTKTPSSPQLEGAIGRLRIPSLGMDVPIVEVSWNVESVEGQPVGVWDTVADAAGHHRGTASFGKPGNCVISGHSSTEQGGVFYGLWDLSVGEEITLVTAAGEEYCYGVQGVEKVQESGSDLDRRLTNATWMAPTEDTRLTLITCWPEWVYTHRVIVVAKGY